MTVTSFLEFFYSILTKCIDFLLSQQFGLPFPIGFLFIVVFILGLVLKYLTMLAN